MAMNRDFNKEDQDKMLSSVSQGRDGEIIRDYVPKDGVQWRWGRPNYARVNDMYFSHRTKKPIPGSPEELVTRVVKNWETDSHHVAKAEDWVTIDHDVYKTSINGGWKADAQYFADVGPYNFLLQDKSSHYDVKLNPLAEEANSFWSSVSQKALHGSVLRCTLGHQRLFSSGATSVSTRALTKIKKATSTRGMAACFRSSVLASQP